ncbi:MAG: LemA family protein [Victivallales bacterium]|jgi:LemA protein
MNTLIVMLVLLSIPFFAVLIFTALMHNILVYRRNAADNVFSTIDVMLKKRYDLIPNLVETVRGYASHEKETLTKISEMRARAVSDNTGINEKINLDGEITSAIGRIFAIAENYPNLKANEQFLNLQKNLSDMEEQIAAARRAYNAAVTDFNNSCEMFPTNIFASLFSFEKKKLFQVSDNEKQPARALP